MGKKNTRPSFSETSKMDQRISEKKQRIKKFDRYTEGNNRYASFDPFDLNMFSNGKFHVRQIQQLEYKCKSIEREYMIKIFLEGLKAEGWTQKEIAEKAGTTQQVISKILNGKNCTIETLIKISKAFNVSADKLLGLDKPSKENRSNSLTDHAPTQRMNKLTK